MKEKLKAILIIFAVTAVSATALICLTVLIKSVPQRQERMFRIELLDESGKAIRHWRGTDVSFNNGGACTFKESESGKKISVRGNVVVTEQNAVENEPPAKGNRRK